MTLPIVVRLYAGDFIIAGCILLYEANSATIYIRSFGWYESRRVTKDYQKSTYEDYGPCAHTSADEWALQSSLRAFLPSSVSYWRFGNIWIPSCVTSNSNRTVPVSLSASSFI